MDLFWSPESIDAYQRLPRAAKRRLWRRLRRRAWRHWQTWAALAAIVVLVAFGQVLLGPTGRAIGCGLGCGLLTMTINEVSKRHFVAAFPNCCGTCGYELLGVESSRCPECGTPRGLFTLHQTDEGD